MVRVSWQWKSVLVVWVLALVCAVLVGLLSAGEQSFTWIGLSLAGCTLATMCVQIGTRRKEGYVSRMTASIVGVVVILAAASGILALIGLG
jgi:di/tricarboxylate transporter